MFLPLPQTRFRKRTWVQWWESAEQAGAFGGAILAWVAGHILLHHSYLPLFIIAGIMHPLAMGVVQLLTPKIEKIPATATF